MTIDVASLQTFTTAQLLTIVELAIAEHARYGKVQQAETLIFERASLAELFQLRDKLKAEITQASRGSVRSYARRQRS